MAKAKSLAVFIQALLRAKAACGLIFEGLHRLPHATHTKSFDGLGVHGERQECLRSPMSDPAQAVRALFDQLLDDARIR
jgi:hypothetical protein